MDSNLGGKQGGAGRPPALTLAGLLYKEGRGAHHPLRLPPHTPLRTTSSSTQTLVAPLSPRGLQRITTSTIAAPPLCHRAAAPCSSPSPLAWLGEALLVEIVIITTTPSCC